MEQTNCQNTEKTTQLNSSQSYDILDNKNSSYDNMDFEDEPTVLDESLDDKKCHSPDTQQLHVPTNTPRNKEESYSTKREGVKNAMSFYKKTNHDIKSRRQIKSLGRHLERLNKAENDGIVYEEFKKMIKADLVVNKGTNESVRMLYED